MGKKITKIDPVLLVKILFAGGDPTSGVCTGCKLYDINQEKDPPICLACARESERIFERSLDNCENSVDRVEWLKKHPEEFY